MIDITPIVQATFALVAALITCFLIPYIKSKTTATQQADLLTLVQTAVCAAEQLYGSSMGREKKAYVLDWLKQHGVTVDESMLDALVEAAVHALKGGTIK